MSNFLIDEDTDLLAAEFVLGTLDSEERTNAQALLRTDHGFIAMVRIWERRFGELHLMVEPVDPDAKIWQRIKTKVAELGPRGPVPEGQAAAMLATESTSRDGEAAPLGAEAPKPEGAEAGAPTSTDAATDGVSAPPAESAMTGEAAKPPELLSLPPAPTLPPAGDLKPGAESRPDSAEGGADGKAAVQTSPLAPALLKSVDRPEGQRATRAGRRSGETAVIRSRGRWRAFGVIMIALGIGFAGLIAAWRFAPELLPEPLRPAQLMMSMGIGSVAQPAPAPRKLPAGPSFDE